MLLEDYPLIKIDMFDEITQIIASGYFGLNRIYNEDCKKDYDTYNLFQTAIIVVYYYGSMYIYIYIYIYIYSTSYLF